MKYGVIINEKNTLTEWGLLLLANVKTEAPTPRTKYITVPEMDGAIDLTESLTGKVVYNQRRVTFELFAPLEEFAFENVRAELAAYANGKRVKLWLPDDPNHYFCGRMTIGGKGRYHNGRISISLMADPWKYKNEESSFVARVSGTVVIMNEGMPTIPRFVSSAAGVNVTLGETTHTLPVGESKFDDMVFMEGQNLLNVQNLSSPKTLKISYQEGRM